MRRDKQDIEFASMQPVGWYIRVSTDDQDLSSQRDALTDWFKHEGLPLPAKALQYEDTGARSDHETRVGFQRMLRDAEAGKVKLIVVDEPQRIFTDDQFMTFGYLGRLRKAGCAVYSLHNELWLTDDDDASVLTTAIKTNQTRGEVLDKSWRVIKAMKERAEKGQYQGGPVPYGMHLVCYSPDGKEVWRVAYATGSVRIKMTADGKKQVYQQGNKIGRDSANILKVQPSNDPKELEVVRMIYRWFAAESISYTAIADRLTKMKIKFHETVWDTNRVRSVLWSSYYVGFATWNKTRQGKYYEFAGGQRVKKAKDGGYWKKKNDWINSNQLFEPVIDPKLWQKVQDKIETLGKTRAPRSTRLWLAGLLVCDGCGRVMRGSANDSPSLKAGRYANTASAEPDYICSTYAEKKKFERRGETCVCGRNMIKQKRLEEVIEKWIDQSGRKLDTIKSAYHNGDQKILEPLVKQQNESWEKLVEKFNRMADFVCDTPEWKNRVDKGRWNSLSMVGSLYEQVFPRESAKVQEELAKLEEEHEELSEKILNLPKAAKLAIEKAGKKLVELEEQIELRRAKSADMSQQFDVQLAECEGLSKAFEEAKAALDGKTTEQAVRQRAESLRKLIDKVHLRFSDQKIQIQIVPKEGDGGRYIIERPNSKSASPNTS